MSRSASEAAGVSPSASLTLLKTKLQIPNLRYVPLARPHLTARLQSDQPVLLLTAPVGAGKTTLLVEWALGSRDAVAWLTLDELDNDLKRFLAYLVTAVAGEDRLDDDAPFEAAMSAISSGLAQTALTLVLDNYHVISNAAIHDALVYLIDHLPPCSRLIIAGRTYPALPLARLRVEGKLGQIDELGFNSGEILAYLAGDFEAQRAAHPQNSISEAVRLLEERTQGWIAGLKLAKLWLKSGADARAFGAGYRHVYDYFMQEVFLQQPPTLQTFLLMTAILDPLCGELCNAVTGHSDGQAMLERLEQLNLFIRPLDDRRRQYRYHPLFRDFLHECLSRQSEALDLHLRASLWHEHSGDLAAAIDHALAAHAWERAANLIERGAAGGLDVAEWLARLPDDFRRTPLLVEPLSDRETEVLHLISSGMSNPEIARRLIIAVSTVKTHVKNIYRKLDVDTRYEAMERARDLNLIQLRMENDFRRLIK